MKKLGFLFVLVLLTIFLSSCSDVKDENPVVPTDEDALTKLLQDVPDDLRSAVLKEIPEDLRKEISEKISDDQLKLLKRNMLVIAFIKASAPAPFYDPNGPCAPLLIVDPVTGTGMGTVLNHFTTLQSHCFNPQTLEISNGQAAFTTAHGNHKLYESYSGKISPTPLPNILIIRGNTSFTGGTGMFNGAEGSGFAAGILNVNTGDVFLFKISTLVLD